MTFHGPSDLIPDAVVDERDARTAQTVLDAWSSRRPPILEEDGASTPWVPALLELRGIMAVALADVRAAGVLEGYRAGQAETLQRAREAVLEALEDLR